MEMPQGENRPEGTFHLSFNSITDAHTCARARVCVCVCVCVLTQESLKGYTPNLWSYH